MTALTAKEKQLLDKVLNQCLSNKKGIASISRDDWANAEALVELGLMEYHRLINDRAWWLTDRGVDAAYGRGEFAPQ